MSENLGLVRSIYSAWERGDFGSAEWADPEIEFVIADGPDPGRWDGLAGMAMAFRDRVSVLADFRPEAEEFRNLDDERVLVLLRPPATAMMQRGAKCPEQHRAAAASSAFKSRANRASGSRRSSRATAAGSRCSFCLANRNRYRRWCQCNAAASVAVIRTESAEA